MPDRATETAAIVGIIASQETAFNTNDATLFAEPWRERSWAVGVTGVELEGRGAVLEAARRGFAGHLAAEHVTYTPGPVEFLGADAAIVHAYARAVTADGEPIDPEPSMIALYVLARDGERWQIVARQNTLVSR